MKNKQYGYTLYELLACLWFLFLIGSFIAVIWMAVHFIAKFW